MCYFNVCVLLRVYFLIHLFISCQWNRTRNLVYLKNGDPLTGFLHLSVKLFKRFQRFLLPFFYCLACLLCCLHFFFSVHSVVNLRFKNVFYFNGNAIMQLGGTLIDCWFALVVNQDQYGIVISFFFLKIWWFFFFFFLKIHLVEVAFAPFFYMSSGRLW